MTSRGPDLSKKGPALGDPAGLSAPPKVAAPPVPPKLPAVETIEAIRAASTAAEPQPPILPEKRPLSPEQEGGSSKPTGRASFPLPRAANDRARRQSTVLPIGEPAHEPLPLSDAAIESAPPWLVSLIVHLVFLVILGLWIVAPRQANIVQLEVALDEPSEDLGEQLDDRPLTISDEHLDTEEVVTPQDLPEVDDPFAAPPELEITPEGMDATSDLESTLSGMALDGRQEGMRQAMLTAFGGNGQSEAAVQSGLEWLARQQRPDGSWSLKGPYSDGSITENRAAATAMAMLAFQGAGHTHVQGQFQKNVAKALRWLLKQQDKEGNFFKEGPHNHPLYTQAQCTIALCELWAMTRDTQLRAAAEKAVAYCVYSQDPGLGGWKYHPRAGSDTSVTGWMVMALQSAKMGGLRVPQMTFDRVGRYLDDVASHGGARYPYMRNGSETPSMTAEALLCREYSGWDRYDPRLESGVKYIMRNLPTWNDRNVYYWYYATQVLHHLEGEPWETWNHVMRDLLVEKQVHDGPESGSWDPNSPTPDRWGGYGGRLFVTSLSIYILEVYYRHLPIYATQLAQP